MRTLIMILVVATLIKCHPEPYSESWNYPSAQLEVTNTPVNYTIKWMFADSYGYIGEDLYNFNGDRHIMIMPNDLTETVYNS